MALQRPPQNLVYAVERQAPGIYGQFFAALNNAHRGIRVGATSFWRDPRENRRVGGAEGSQHQLGTAIDLIYPTAQERRSAIASMQRQRLIVIDEGDHVHVQAWPAHVGLLMLKRLGILR